MNYLTSFAGKRKRPHSTSGSSTISTKTVSQIVERLRFQRCRDSTRATYYCVWKVFSKFYFRLDVKPPTWEERIVLLTAFLIDNKLKSTSVRSYLSAIRCIIAEDGIRLNEDWFLINSLTRACKLKNDELTIRFLIHKDLLHSILCKVETHYMEKKNQPYLCYLIKAMLLTGCYGLLRVGELTLSPHVVLADNVHIGENKKKILLVLLTSKTHGKGNEPQMIKITSKPVAEQEANSQSFCPFKALSNYIQVRPKIRTENEQFFVFSDNSPVKAQHLSSYLKLMLTKLKFKSHLYSLHSLRGGRTVDLFNLGLSVETIKKIGRWKSNAVFNYLKTASTF